MREKIDLPQTFKAIRQLPLEVSLQQVQRWIDQHTLPQKPSLAKRLKWWFKKWSNT